jgi:hypothetical protein
MPQEKINKGGRPTKYKPEYVRDVEKLCKLGATDKDLADFFSVDEDTINEWKKVHPEFSESLKRGKMKADMEVADRLFTRATGYQYHEVTKEKAKEGDEMVITKEVIKEIAPDPVSMIFWLKNRRKDLWRDKQDHGFDLNNDIVVRRPMDEEGDNS